MLQAPVSGRAQAALPGAGVIAAGRRLLLVEDGPVNRTIAAALLQRAGFEVCTACNGAEAVEAVARAAPFDLVLMDLDMPVMDGFAAAATIRDLGGACRDLPIVSLAAQADRADVARARAAGMTGHIDKPFAPATFAADVARHLGAGTVAPEGIWNRDAFANLMRRLGPAQAEPVLGMFEARLLQARRALTGASVTRAAVAFQAHALIATAGLLGFGDLCAVSVEAQSRTHEGPDAAGPDASGLAVGLVRAIERALGQMMRPLP